MALWSSARLFLSPCEDQEEKFKISSQKAGAPHKMHFWGPLIGTLGHMNQGWGGEVGAGQNLLDGDTRLTREQPEPPGDIGESLSLLRAIMTFCRGCGGGCDDIDAFMPPSPLSNM